MDSRTGARDGIIAMLSVALDRAATEPLVRQLYLRVRELILTDRLAAGTRLPSTRKLSRDLEVSRTVTLDAFAQLSAEGFLCSRQGSGHFVAELPVGRNEASANATAPAAQTMGATIWNSIGEPFDPAWQAVDLFPANIWSRMLGRGWRRHQQSALERHWAGLPVLREAVAQHLHALRGLAATPDQIMITAGNWDAMTIIARCLTRRRRAAVSCWVEDPGLGTARDTLASEGVTPIPVPVDEYGLVVAEGETRAPDASSALVTPTRQFPLGMPLSLPRRLSLLGWAERSGAILIEDDYDAELRFSGRPLQSLASLDPGASVLTLGSFSKLTFPGLRLGYVAGPAELIAELVAVRREMLNLVPTNVQTAFAEFILTGSFARHLRQLRTSLTRRRRALHDFLNDNAGGLIEILPQEAGMNLTVRLQDGVARHATDVEFSAAGRERGLVLLPLSPQYISQPPLPGFLLGYAGWREEQLTEAATRFVHLLRETAIS